MAWIEKLQQASKPAVRGDQPWTAAVARTLPGGITSISTRSLFDLLDLPATTGNARRLATSMRALGFVPIKSRRLEPGGRYGTTIRGWARPVRQPGFRAPPEAPQSALLVPKGASYDIHS